MFQLSNNWVWTGEFVSNDSSSAGLFGFFSGSEYSDSRSPSDANRVLAVRSPM
jgi:hypothetical protein